MSDSYFTTMYVDLIPDRSDWSDKPRWLISFIDSSLKKYFDVAVTEWLVTNQIVCDCRRSTEEIFALFISMAFAVDAFKDVVAGYSIYVYW